MRAIEFLPYQQPDIITYSTQLADSFKRWVGRELIHPYSAEALYHAPFILVSHGTEADPVFRYANLAAQRLWGMDWSTFIALPSRMSAEPDAQEERTRLLATAEKQGFVDNYRGVRVTASGRRFAIENCILWNVLNETGDKIGQAATFSAWEWL
jgi:hypothetical protein